MVSLVRMQFWPSARSQLNFTKCTYWLCHICLSLCNISNASERFFMKLYFVEFPKISQHIPGDVEIQQQWWTLCMKTTFVCFLITNVTPNVVVEWLTLLLRIREVLGSNLGPDIGYTDWGVSWVSSVPPAEFEDRTFKLGHDRFYPNPYQFIIH
jgi:hypothetical protein